MHLLLKRLPRFVGSHQAPLQVTERCVTSVGRVLISRQTLYIRQLTNSSTFPPKVDEFVPQNRGIDLRFVTGAFHGLVPLPSEEGTPEEVLETFT